MLLLPSFIDVPNEAGRRKAMAANREEILGEIQETFGLVPEWMKGLPQPSIEGYWKLFRDFHLAETQIPNKYKELIGIAVSGATRCRYCVLFHTESARLHGATDEEINEASMAGAVTMLGSTYLNAYQVDYDQFAKETESIVSYVKEKQQQPRGDGEEPTLHA
jgi:AhpD family alkylhydroperoxidase